MGLLCMGLRPEVALAIDVISGREVEPNNTYETANGAIASGATISGSVTCCLFRNNTQTTLSEDDIFAIYVSQPGIISLKVNSGTYDTTTIRAYIINSSFEGLASDYATVNKGYELRLEAAVPKAGTYYLYITSSSRKNENYSFTVTYPTAVTLKIAPIWSTAQTSSQSFVRFYNSGTAAGTVVASLYDAYGGMLLGSWTSPSIPAGAQVQYPVSTIESGIGLLTKPTWYLLSVKPGDTFKGSFQHVLYRPADRTFSNLSTCDSGFATSATKTLIGVHTSIIEGYGFPSYIAINNTGASATTVSLGIYDARNGTKLGTVNTASVPSNSLSFVTMSSLEKKAGISPIAGMDHYVIKAESNFTGYLQHLVNSNSVNLLTDITATCSLGSP